MKLQRLILALAVFFPALAFPENRHTTLTDITYVERDDDYSQQRCKLDIHYPEEVTDAPVVVWFHGGGLTGGEKFIPEELANSGMVIVAPNYRLLPNVEIDKTIDDAAAAVAWVFRNIGNYGGSDKKIFVAGHSAGGYLTSLIGLDKKWLNKYDIDADSIAALVPYSGQVITHFAKRQEEGIPELTPTIDEYAPLYHVRNCSPPYIIITGDREMELYGRHEENAYMWRMMKLNGKEDTFIYELDGYDHGDMAAPAHHILKHHIQMILENR